MFTRIRIYNTTDTSVEYDNMNDDFGIVSGSLYLNRRIATQDLEFGQFNSALFQCTVFGFEDDIQGRHIVVSQIDDNDVETNLFNGIIDSAKRDRLGEDRTISAYDWMYYHRDDNMATFWNNYWSNISNSTIVNFRNALLTYLGVPNNPATLPNDNVVIKNAFIDQPVTKLPLNGLMKTLCTVSGAFVYIDENGYLTFKTLSSTTVANLTGKVEGQNSEWEDYITKQITGIGIYDTSNNLAQLVGTTDNVYNIVGNYFFLSMDATQLTSVCNTLLTSLQGVQYVPAKLALKLPEDLSLGDYVQTDNGNTYIFSIELSGVTFINQKVESSASGDTLPQTVEFEEDTLIQGAKISRLQKDIDGLESEFSDLETDIGENYYTKSQTDSVIAQSAVEIKTEVTEEVTEAVLEQVGGQADNLIPFPYAFDSQVLNGLTFTVSDVDGSITVDGTATDDTDFIIIDIARTDYNTITLSKLDYVISGCPEDGSLNTYYLAVNQSAGTSVVDIARDYGHEIVGGLSNKFTVTDDESPIGCYIHVASGTTVEDIVFKPQLEYGQVKHEYQYTTTSKTSKIDQHSDEIVLKVDVNGKIVEANLSANASTGTEFKVSADNIDFIANDMINLTANNLGIQSTNFTLDAQGNVDAKGTITATSFKFWDTIVAYTSYGQTEYDFINWHFEMNDDIWMSIYSPYMLQDPTTGEISFVEAIRLLGPVQSEFAGYTGALFGKWNVTNGLTVGGNVDIENGIASIHNTTIDASKANNNISSGIKYPTTTNILDFAGRIMVRLEGVINSNGSIGAYWYVQNYNTSGGRVAQKGIAMHMNKSGTLTYSISDGTAFATAIGKYARSSIGTLDWGSNNEYLLTKSAIAHWNGCYSGTSSNLQYCDRGRFGTIVTKGSGDYPTTTTVPSGYRVRAGTKVVTVTGATATVVFTQAEVNSITGSTGCTGSNTVVYVSNGDYNAQSHYISACIYNPSNKTWCMASVYNGVFTAGNFRATYIVIKFA